MAPKQRNVSGHTRRDIMMALALATTPLLGLPSGARAQTKWPDKPIRIVLPFGAGGVADFTLRTLADRLSKRLGKRVYIENRPGPGGIDAALSVVNAPPDGYTMGLVAILAPLSVATFKKLPYDPVTQFEMVSTVGTFDMVFAVKTDAPYRTLGDFIKAAHEYPGVLNVGTIATGSAQNFGAELFKSMAKTNVVIVPFHRSPDVVMGLLRNDIQMTVEFPPAIQGQINSGDIRVLASSGAKRWPSTPDIPTAAEAGVAGYEVTSWNGVFAPKGTPKAIVEAMNKAIREELATPEVKSLFAGVGVESRGSTPEELMALLKADIQKWEDVMVTAGIPKK